MTRKHQSMDMTSEDRVMLNELIDSLTTIFNGGIGPNTTDVALKVYAKLSDKNTAQYRRVITSAAVEGLRRHIQARFTAEKSKVRLSTTGNVVQMPSRMGAKATDENGVIQPYFDHPYWWDMEWDRFARTKADRIRNRNALSHEIAAMDEIERLRDRYPESRTPGEACEMAGIDPRTFGLEATG